MTNIYDCIIIGGGVIGCSAARELSRYQINIALLEGSEDICNGQSKANTGIVHAGYDAKPGTQKALYNVKGNAMFEETCRELDVPYERNSSLVVAMSQEDQFKLNELFDRGLQNGVPGLKLLGREETLKAEPNLNPKITGALLAETAGIVCPYELTYAFAENAVQNGVRVFRSTPVTSIRKKGNLWEVHSHDRTFFSKRILNAAGIHADEINAMVSSERFHIQARKGEYCLIDKQYADSFHASIFQIPSRMGKGIMVARTVDGTILLGPTAEDIDEKEWKDTSAEGIQKVLEGARITWPQLPVRAVITQFSGIRAHPDTDDFIIGESSDAPGFFNASGIESPGLTSSPAIAKDAAKMIAESLNASLKADFQPVRHAFPHFRDVSNELREEMIRQNNDYAKIVCRCEMVTEAEIREAIRRPVGATTLDGIKRRIRAGMGRCQSGFCTPRLIQILSEELGIPEEEVTKCEKGSSLLLGPLFADKNDEKGGRLEKY